MKNSTTHSSLNFVAAALITSFILAACGGGGAETTASNVSVAVPKSSVIAASMGASSRASSRAASSSSVAASIAPAGSTISNVNATSHNAGENCMNCHLAGGAGASKAIFTLAGTVSGGAGVTIKLILHNQNQITATVMSDKSGNFYTTVPVVGISTDGSLVNGVDAYSGNNKMGGVVGNGACNSCHSPAGGTGRIN